MFFSHFIPKQRIRNLKEKKHMKGGAKISSSGKMEGGSSNPIKQVKHSTISGKNRIKHKRILDKDIKGHYHFS